MHKLQLSDIYIKSTLIYRLNYRLLSSVQSFSCVRSVALQPHGQALEMKKLSVLEQRKRSFAFQT